METNGSTSCQEARIEDEDTRPKELQLTQETVKINAQGVTEERKVCDGEAHIREKELEEEEAARVHDESDKYCKRMNSRSTGSGRRKEKDQNTCGALWRPSMGASG